MKIKNKQSITKIIMRPFAECMCVLGGDWYHIDFEVTFEADEYYPDYMDVVEFISKNISGAEMDIEDALVMLGDYLKNEYSPKGLEVTADVKRAYTHFPVTVTKTY